MTAYLFLCSSEQRRSERSVLFIDLVILGHVLLKDLILVILLLLNALACVQLLSLVYW